VRLDHRGVTDQSDCLELSGEIAGAVERTAIARTEQSVIANQTQHENRVQRTRGQKLDDFRFVAATKFADVAGLDGSANRCSFPNPGSSSVTAMSFSPETIEDRKVI
jgi:hypothetical protein